MILTATAAPFHFAANQAVIDLQVGKRLRFVLHVHNGTERRSSDSTLVDPAERAGAQVWPKFQVFEEWLLQVNALSQTAFALWFLKIVLRLHSLKPQSQMRSAGSN